MTRPVRVLSLYEGFFAGGARVLHTDLISGLHARGAQQHSVLSIASEAHRESTRQPMAADPRYQHLLRAGIGVTTLGRSAGAEPPGRHTFTDRELLVASAAVRQADVILSLKEQPLGLLLALSERGLLPPVPVATCLHRSDPIHSGPALGWLVEATVRHPPSASWKAPRVAPLRSRLTSATLPIRCPGSDWSPVTGLTRLPPRGTWRSATGKRGEARLSLLATESDVIAWWPIMPEPSTGSSASKKQLPETRQPNPTRARNAFVNRPPGSSLRRSAAKRSHSG